MGNGKIVFYDKILIDLTKDTITPNVLLKGYTAHNATGDQINGTCDFDANTSGVTATPDSVLDGLKFIKDGEEKVGTMPMNGSANGVISDINTPYNIRYGHHDGGGTVDIAQTEKDKLIPENIRQGISILGVAGSMTGSEGVNAQSKEVVASNIEQIVLPDIGYNYLSEVKVLPIPYRELENEAGGITVIIGE